MMLALSNKPSSSSGAATLSSTKPSNRWPCLVPLWPSGQECPCFGPAAENRTRYGPMMWCNEIEARDALIQINFLTGIRPPGSTSTRQRWGHSKLAARGLLLFAWRQTNNQKLMIDDIDDIMIDVFFKWKNWQKYFPHRTFNLLKKTTAGLIIRSAQSCGKYGLIPDDCSSWKLVNYVSSCYWKNWVILK